MKGAQKKLGRVIAGWLLACAFSAPGINRPTTTVYVRRDFEVRDHDLPVKYVFNGNTRVARVTGSLAVRERIQRFRLYGGWNLLSLAIASSDLQYQITNMLPSIEAPQSLFCWNEVTSTWAPLPAGQPVAAGAILWLHSLSNASLALTGTYADPTNRSVNASGSFLPSAGLETWELNSTVSGGSSVSAWSYEPLVSGWLSWLAAPLQSGSGASMLIAPGSAMFVRPAVVTELQVPQPALAIRYYHPDHIGSAAVMSDAAGAAIQEATYYPFGSIHHRVDSQASHDPYGFGQKEKDGETYLSYFEARYLLSTQARFASADPAYASLERLPDQKRSALLQQPQLLNLYSYALNSPFRYEDPTGLKVVKLNWVQTIVVVAAQKQAIAMLDDAIARVQQNMNACSGSDPADQMLEKWFGFENGLGNKEQIVANLQKIRTQIARLGPENFLYDSAPKRKGAVARVLPDDPNHVYLMDKFFASPDFGLDSKAGTLIHENSHPLAVLGTRDFVYGANDAANLASKDNGKALKNADNYEYFNEGLQTEEVVSRGVKYFNDLQAGKSEK